MKRAIDILLNEHRIVSTSSSVALVSLILAFLAIGSVQLLHIGGHESLHPANVFIGLLLGVALVFSLISMITATFAVIRRRRELCDWGSFLIIIWALPYIGISIYLGGSNLIATMQSHRRANKSP